MFHFLHTYQPQPIVFNLGFVSIHWYGLLMVIGFLAGYLVSFKLAKKYKLSSKNFDEIVFYGLIFGLIGARIYHVLWNIPYYIKYPVRIFEIWQGGLGVFGVIIAGALVLFFYAKKHKISFLFLLDLFIPGAILGQAIIRWGNWFNQELFGLPVKWGIPISLANRPEIYQNFTYFHPTFLYESIWCFLIFIILMLCHYHWMRRYSNPDREISAAHLRTHLRVRPLSGKIFALYLILYSFERFFIEFLRVDFQPLFLGLKSSQIVSIILFAIGLILIIKHGRDPLKGPT